MENLFNVAIYIRLSREDGDKEESNSVVNQRKLLLNYISNKEDLFLYDVYIDDGFTGTNFDRPSFKRMIKDVENDKVNCVIVKDLSRFGRDYIETGKYLERYFQEKGVRFIALSDNIDTLKREYDMFLPIKNIFNEQYSRDISNKILATVKSKQQAGDFVGAFTSYGYKKSPKNKNKLIVDEYPASIVRKIFDLFVQGYGKDRIAKILNDEGVLCPTEYKRLNGSNYINPRKLEKTTYWSYSTIHKILQKEVYIGNMVQGTKRQRLRSKQMAVPREDWIIVENTHEPIIDIETWEKAQSILNKRTRNLDLECNMSIFAGFLKCGDCGRAMAKNVWKLSDGTPCYTFNCGTYKKYGKQYCTAHTISQEVLENVVLDDLKIIVKSIENLKELVNSQKKSFVKIEKFVDAELKKTKLELEKVQKFKQSLYEDYREELITKEEFISFKEDYVKKEKLFTQQIQQLQKKQKQSEKEEVFESPWIKRLLRLKYIERLDRDIVTLMISEIKVYEDRKIKIIYNFSNELEHLFSSVYGENENVI